MKRVILSAAFALSALAANSQDNENPNRKLFFGFNLGVNYSNIQVWGNDFDVMVRNDAGLTISTLMGYRFSKNWSLQGSAGISFHQNQLYSFDISAPSQIFYRGLLANTLDFSIQPTYQFNTKGNKSPYILLGPAIQIPISKPILSTEFSSTTNVALELGFGLNVKFSEFTFAPELRYSYGINNVNENPVLKNVNFHCIKFLFNFKS